MQINKCLSIKGAEDTLNKPFAFEISTSTENLFFIAESEKVWEGGCVGGWAGQGLRWESSAGSRRQSMTFGGRAGPKKGGQGLKRKGREGQKGIISLNYDNLFVFALICLCAGEGGLDQCRWPGNCQALPLTIGE